MNSRDLTQVELPEWLEELKAHPLDDDYLRPAAGGCWICNKGDGWDEDQVEDFEFSIELDAFYHTECLKIADENMDREIETLLDFERSLSEVV